jgi:hypothetical protein
MAPEGDQRILITNTQLVSSQNPSAFGQTVTFSATVTSTSGDPIPGGRVRFDVDGIQFFANVDIASDGTAQFSTSSLTLGTHEIVAMYSGYQPAENDGLPDAQPSSVTLEQVVLVGTDTTVASSANPSIVGDPVTFTATVFTDGVAAAGDVTFFDGAAPLGTVEVDANGQASLTTTVLTAGVHTITARYNGTVELLPSSAEVVQQVNEPSAPTSTSTTTTTTTPTSTSTTTSSTSTSTSTTSSTTLPGQSETVTELSSSPNPSVAGQTVTFTATVTTVGGPGGVPSGFRSAVAPRQVDGGTVTISDGGTVLAIVPVEGGPASFTTSGLSAGAHTITATFSGTTSAAPSSATIVQQVDAPPPTTQPATLPATR